MLWWLATHDKLHYVVMPNDQTCRDGRQQLHPAAADAVIWLVYMMIKA